MSPVSAATGLGPPRVEHAPERAAGGREEASPVAFLVLVCCVTVAVRVAYVRLPLRSDEGGYLMAARHWAPGTGRFTYGDYQVDRPPLLMAIYRLAALWESDAAIRVITIPFVVVGVLALARAGMLLAGATGAQCAAAVGAALLCSPALAGEEADGELFATVLVAASVAATLRAWHPDHPSRLVRYAVLAGALAAAATLVKQNFVDGFVFACVLLLAHGLRRRRVPARARAVTTGFVVGAVAAYALVLGWALSAGVDLGHAWADVVTFRGDALAVILHGRLHAPATRLYQLFLFAVLAMVVPIAWVWLRWLRARRWRADPEHWALTALLACAVCSIAAGGSYWQHYLLQTTTPVALAAGVVAAGAGATGRLGRRLTGVTVASALACAAVMVAGYALVPMTWYPQHVGHWLRASSAPGDTAFVAYGHPSVLEAADLPSPYPYLWSLQMRTLDPGQAELRRTLSGPDAPTWLVRTDGLDSWGIDAGGRLRDLVDARYELVATVCGQEVYLRVGADRHLAPTPGCGDSGS